MGKAGLDESQARIKSAERNTNNLRCADDITLMAEIKSLLMRVIEESVKASVKLKIKTKLMASGPITSWQIEVGKGGRSDRFPLLEL